MQRGYGRRGEGIAKAYVFPYDLLMKTITASKARANLYRLIEETADSSEPIQITGKRINAVLVSEEDWRSMQETMYLLSIPGMRESIREGMATPLEECSEEIDW
jgi:prevent-host-death family protein